MAWGSNGMPLVVAAFHAFGKDIIAENLTFQIPLLFRALPEIDEFLPCVFLKERMDVVLAFDS